MFFPPSPLEAKRISSQRTVQQNPPLPIKYTAGQGFNILHVVGSQDYRGFVFPVQLFDEVPTASLDTASRPIVGSSKTGFAGCEAGMRPSHTASAGPGKAAV